MNDDQENSELTLEKSWELLPWYLNGTLNDEERTQVERDLQLSEELREELAQQKRLFEAVATRNHLDVVEDANWDRIAGILDEEKDSVPEIKSAPAETDNIVLLRRPSEKKATSFPWALGGLIAACLAIVVFVAQDNVDYSIEFQTLTNPQDGSDGMLRIKAAEGVGVAEIKAYIATHSLTVLDGPSATGVYTLRANDESGDLDALVAEMQGSAKIAFVTRLEGTN